MFVDSDAYEIIARIEPTATIVLSRLIACVAF
jgi:hypothetical protein